MHYTIVAATLFEIEPLRQYLDKNFQTSANWTFQKGDNTVQLLITGVGMTATGFALGQYLSQVKTDLIINAGIAGAFDKNLKIGEVVLVEKDRFGDLGVEEANGRFTDMHELELIPKNDYPYSDGWLINPESASTNFLKKVSAITINKVHGTEASIEKIQKKYPVNIESMEGAAVHYAALMNKISFLQIRSISNFVEKRNRENWDIPKAIAELNMVLIEMVKN